MTKTSARYSPEVRARAVRMVLDHQADRSLGPVAFGASLNKIQTLQAHRTEMRENPRLIQSLRHDRLHHGMARLNADTA